MKTQIFRWLLCAAGLFALTACDSNNDNDSSGDNTKQESTNYPSEVPTTVAQALASLYPSASYVSSETLPDGRLVVTINDGNIQKEAYFTSDNQWIQTQWPVTEASLPAAVSNALANDAAFEGYTFDFGYFIEYPSGENAYNLHLKKEGSLDMVVNLAPDGSMILG